MPEHTPKQVYDIIFPRSIREEIDEFKENVLKEMRENDNKHGKINA